MSVRDPVIKERAANPYATLKQIADKYGVTKERVRQILASENLPTRHCQFLSHYVKSLYM